MGELREAFFVVRDLGVGKFGHMSKFSLSEAFRGKTSVAHFATYPYYITANGC